MMYRTEEDFVRGQKRKLALAIALIILWAVFG